MVDKDSKVVAASDSRRGLRRSRSLAVEGVVLTWKVDVAEVVVVAEAVGEAERGVVERPRIRRKAHRDCTAPRSLAVTPSR